MVFLQLSRFTKGFRLYLDLESQVSGFPTQRFIGHEDK